MSINEWFWRCWTTIYTHHYTFSGVTKKNLEIYIPKIKQTNKNEKYIPKSKSFSCRDESRLSILSCLSISWWILMLSLSSPDKQQSPILNSLNLLQYFAVNTFINHSPVLKTCLQENLLKHAYLRTSLMNCNLQV